MPADKSQIGGIVRSAREAMGLTQEDLAKKCSVSKHTVLAVENNQRKPSFDVFCRLVHALDISADLIVYPHRTVYTLEQEQFIRELLACTEKEQRIAFALIQCLLRALRHDVSEKQG
jgi:transcriptional regulator with XRE-family HTH domain